MTKKISGNNDIPNKSKGNIIDYIKTKKWEYGDGEKPSSVVRDLPSMSKADEYNAYFNKESPKYYNRPKSKIRDSGTMDIAWDLPSDLEEDVYGTYLDLLKSGDLTPGTSFKDFEENYSNYDAKLLQKKKKMEENILSNAIAKIDNSMSGLRGILHLGGGGSTNKPREPKIKKLNLADYFKVGIRVTDLTPIERKLINELVKKSLSYNKDN